jgi:hypothetical protein
LLLRRRLRRPLTTGLLGGWLWHALNLRLLSFRARASQTRRAFGPRLGLRTGGRAGALGPRWRLRPRFLPWADLRLTGGRRSTAVPVCTWLPATLLATLLTAALLPSRVRLRRWA